MRRALSTKAPTRPYRSVVRLPAAHPPSQAVTACPTFPRQRNTCLHTAGPGPLELRGKSKGFLAASSHTCQTSSGSLMREGRQSDRPVPSCELTPRPRCIVSRVAEQTGQQARPSGPPRPLRRHDRQVGGTLRLLYAQAATRSPGSACEHSKAPDAPRSNALDAGYEPDGAVARIRHAASSAGSP